MREIKFRAWDTDEKVMRPVDCMFLPLGRPSGKDITAPCLDKVDWPDTSEWVYDYKLMQYTGLKDKNGVEIYEGDVVRRTHHQAFETDYEDGTYLIEWSEVGFIGKPSVKGTVGTWRPSNNSPRHREGIVSFEVIGNIYENPDLLEKESI